MGMDAGRRARVGLTERAKENSQLAPAECEAVKTCGRSTYVFGEAYTPFVRLSEGKNVVHRTTVTPRPWGDRCLSWDLVDCEDLIVVEEEMPPGTSETPHRHRKAHQFFFVLEGRLEIDVAGVVHRLDPFHGLEVLPTVLHVVRNSSAGTTRFLAVAAPTTKGDRSP
jgi:mannose-6-phosphate isomerase-like protein (cupin superfamily)